MGNHYHLCLETPRPNLVEGMRWLQSTFANRFNRFRKANGHVFQGRYKALLLDAEALGNVCHYIHLNPVRAGIVSSEDLEAHVDSSFAQLWDPRKRWTTLKSQASLEAASGLRDTPAGRRLYRDYLSWLAATKLEQNRLGFNAMSRGWAKGTNEFKKGVPASLPEKTLKTIVEAEASSLREYAWEKWLRSAL